jgi:hypothetical protein
METPKIITLTEDDFHKKFKRQKNLFDTNASFDGCMFETYGEEVDYIFEMNKTNRVVTIIEGDEDGERTFISDLGVEITEPIPNLHYISGFHLVNRLGYFILDKPYEFEFEVTVD